MSFFFSKIHFLYSSSSIKYDGYYDPDTDNSINIRFILNTDTHNGAIRYPQNSATIGAKPTTFPIIDFLEINLSFESLRFS